MIPTNLTNRLSFLTLLILVMFLPTTQAALNDNLVGYWSFDGDDPNSTTIEDCSGNGKSGTINGNPQWVTGRSGGALSFDGDGDYVEIADTEDYDPNSIALPNNALTLSAWVKFSNTNTDNLIVSKHKSRVLYGYFLSVKDNCFASYINQDVRLQTSTTYADGNWHHVAQVYDGSTHRFYVDGNSVASEPKSYSMANAQSVNIRIGASNPVLINGVWVDGDYFNGVIDEVRIYNRALDPNEIAVLSDPNLLPITVTGNVDLLYHGCDPNDPNVIDLNGPDPNMQVTVSIHNPGDPNTTLETHVVTLNANGDYSFTTTLVGTYDIAFKASHWLRKRVSNVSLTTSQVTVDDVSLDNGDVNGDNHVTVSDYLVITQNWNQSVTPDTNGDLNGSGTVNFADYQIFGYNAGLDGDPPNTLP